MKPDHFQSPEPRVALINSFADPYENAVATARTCYSSSGIILPGDVAAKPTLRDRIASTIYEAGHHTTLQHAHVQFGLENVSRHFIWSFLHSHPFYNSEQVSQRYVRVDPSQMAIPPLAGEALAVYERVLQVQTDAYLRLCELLEPTVEHFYYELFPSRQPSPRRDGKAHPIARRWIPKKGMEVARYVLPVATFAYMYHTVSILTLLRYHRLCQQYDTPTETQIVVEKMVQALLAEDPQISKVMEEPLPLEKTLEFQYWSEARSAMGAMSQAYRREFDVGLDGKVSKLVSWKPENETILAQAVREVLGVTCGELDDRAAIALVLDPSKNRYYGEAMNVTTMSKLSRTLHHPHYTFRKKLSHTADSQDQRHRMTPGSRPMLSAYLSEEPDYVVPGLVRHNPDALALFEDTMERTWEGINMLRVMGVQPEYAAYLLPNAVAIRFTESGDLMALHHKLRMRLCYNAQEEIFLASKDEAIQIAEANPEIGQYLGAPCTLRYAASARPFCPEGDRYCGVPVWNLEIADYERVL
jgi:thymidylate synthase ThyX